MFNPPRPEIDDDIRQKAAERFIRKFPDIQEQYDESEIINQLVSASRWADDGYRMAEELEICFSWEMDFNTVEELDSFNSFVRTTLEAAEKAWAEENRIQPPLATGTKVTYKRGWEQKTGEISGIYKFWPACYTIQEDGAPSNMSAVLKYEDVQAV